MEVQLQELLAAIKKDGVDSAEKEKTAIIIQAEELAEDIITAARKQADTLRDTAKQDAARFERSAKEAVNQAGRDLLISVQKALQNSFDHILTSTISEHFSGEALTEGIVAVVKAFNSTGELELPPETLRTIETNLKARLGAEIKAGLKIQGKNLPEGGFILREDGGSAYYDFSSRSIAEVIRSRLSQNIADLIDLKE